MDLMYLCSDLGDKNYNLFNMNEVFDLIAELDITQLHLNYNEFQDISRINFIHIRF